MADECAVIEKGRRGYYRKVVCPKAVWAEGSKPVCQGAVTVAFLDITDRNAPFPVRMNIKGAAMTPYHNFLKEYNNIKTVARIRRCSVYDYAVRLTSNDMGTYFVPQFTLFYDDKEPSVFLPLTNWYVQNMYMNRVQEEEENKKLVDTVEESEDSGAEESASTEGLDIF